MTPAAPSFARGGKPASGNAGFVPMEISPKSFTMAVGSTTNVSVTYRDQKGNLVPDSDFRLTYYGCVPVAPAGATCNDLLTILPLTPSLRQAQIHALSAGQARIFASDGMGIYVWSDLTIQ
jgi:hypothetical protein